MSISAPTVAERFRPYREYRDSGVEWLGQIPANWRLKRLKHLANIASGFAPPESYDKSIGDYPVYGANGLIGFCDKHLVSVQTLAVGRVGASGSVNLVPAWSWVSDNALLLRDLRPAARLRWLRYVLETMNLGTLAAKNAQPIITGKFLGDRLLAAPPESEQEAISTFLDRETSKLDALIAKKERLIELLQQKRAALITHAVTKGLDPDVPMKDSGVEWLGEIPAHWELVKTKHLITFITSGSRGWAEYYADEGAIFLQSGNLNRKLGLDLAQVQYVDAPTSAEGRRTLVEKGDVLICITGALTGNVGVIREEPPEAYVNQHLALVRPNSELADSLFLAYSLSSKIGWRQFDLLQYGGTKQGLGLDDVKDVVIPCPPLDEQRILAQELMRQVSQLDSVCEKIQEGIDRLQEFRTALISAAVTGKIDVRKEAA